MNTAEAKNQITEALDRAKEALSKIGVNSETNVALEQPIEKESTGFIYGGLVVGGGIVDDDNCLFFPLDLEISESGNVDSEEFESAISDFNTQIDRLLKRLSESDDKKAAILSVGEDMYKERDFELMKQVEKLNKDTTTNLKIALYAGGIMLLIAALCILASKIFA